MKTKLFLLTLILLTKTIHSQNYLQISFENPSVYNYHIEIDTINYPSNKWQIGKPSKQIFNQAASLSNAIVTDTINTIPPSDTSIFIMKAYNPYFFPVPSFVISTMYFYYKLNKDSSDIAMVEVAADTGMHWVNMLDEDTTYNIVWYGNKPNFADTSSGWKIFQSNFSQWFSSPYSSGFYPYYADADTFRFRFTFISSPTSVNKEGWMIDDIFFGFGTPEGIEQASNLDRLNLFYPNPARNFVRVKRGVHLKSANESFRIYSADGKCVHQQSVQNQDEVKIELKPGLYFFIYQSGDKYQSHKIMIE